MRQNSLLGATLIGLPALLFFGILTLWIPQEWAIAILESGILLYGIVWAVFIAFGWASVRLDGTVATLAAATLWPLVQLGAGSTIYAWKTWNSFWTWTVYFVVFFLSVQVGSDGRYRFRFIRALLYFSFGLSAVSILQMFTSGGKIFWIFDSGYTDFVLGPFVYQNQYAAFIELTLPIALYFSLARKNALKFSVMAAVMAGSVAASASRAGSVLVALEIIAVPLLARRTRLVSQRSAARIVLATVGFTTAAVLIVGGAALARHFSTPDPYFLRRELLISSMHMIADRPGFGFGLGTWALAYPHYAIFDPGVFMNQAHNDWAQWAVEGGIPFAALMLGFAALLVRRALRSVWGLGVLCVLAHCLVDYPLQQRPALACVFFSVAGLVAASQIGSSRNPRSMGKQRVRVVQPRPPENDQPRSGRIVEVR